MEVVGGVASIITLIEAAGFSAKISKNLVLRWRNAPREIQDLAKRLAEVAAELQNINNATSKSHPVLTDAIIRQSLSDLLDDVRKRLLKLENLHSRLAQHGYLRQRVQWTLKDARSAEKMLHKTRELEQKLANMMTLISVAQTPILDGLRRIEDMISTLVVAVPLAAPVGLGAAPFANKRGSTTSHTESDARRPIAMSLSALSKSWEPWGFRGSLFTTKQGHHIGHNINFSISLPLARILGSYTLTGCLSLRSHSLYRSALALRHPSYFTVARVVGIDHPFMLACQEGNVTKTHFMLQSGESRQTDVTPCGMTPMRFAVSSGNTQVVGVLLDCGYDIDGMLSTRDSDTALTLASYLQDLDMVRFLLQRGADADFVTSDGIGCSDVCWFRRDDPLKHSSMDVLKVLNDAACLPLDASRTLQVAAMEASGSQVDDLVRLGADIDHGISYAATPIQMAAYYGNYSAYWALVLYYEETAFVEDMDFKVQLLFRTLSGGARHLTDLLKNKALHPDRSQEYDKILMDIIQQGVRPDTVLQVPGSKLPRALLNLQGQTMTPIALAAAFGPDIEAWYLNIASSIGLLIIQEDVERLRELHKAGHGCAESVYIDEASPQSAHPTTQGASKESSSTLDRAECKRDNRANIAVADRSACDAVNEDEVDVFWDAEEDV